MGCVSRGVALVISFALWVALSVPAPAWAGTPDVFGLGSRSSALGGAVAADVTDFTAAYYNPAGLAFSRSRHVAFGAVAARSHLDIDGRRFELTDPFGLIIGAAAPVPLGGALEGRLFAGTALFLLPGTVVRIIAREPDQPFFPYYDNRTQRAVVLPTLAVRVTDRLAAGVSFNILADLDGAVVAMEGSTRALEPRVDEEIGTFVKLNAGVRYEVTDRYRLGLTFREAFDVPFRTVSRNTVAGEPVDITVEAAGLYTPGQLVVGQALDLAPVRLVLDLTWARWSTYDGPYVRVDSTLPLAGDIDAELPAVPFSDTLSARLGAESSWTLCRGAGPTLFARGAYGFETSPVPRAQPGVTNLLDGPKHTLSAGAGVTTPPVAGERRLHIDVHIQAQLVGRLTLRKRVAAAGEDPAPFDGLRDEDPMLAGTQISNPGYPSVSGGGQVFSGGVTVGVDL